MRRKPAQGRAGSPVDPIICRTLRREYRLHVPDSEAREIFRFMQVDPQVDGYVLEPKDVFLERRDGFWRLDVPGEIIVEGSARHVIWEIYRHVFRDIHISHPTCPLLHCATVLIDGRRIAIVGGKGAGKTTLTLFLLAAGYAIEGDEHLVIEPQRVITRPRTLRIKEGSFDVLANLPPTIRSEPRIELWDGGFVYGVSPGFFGRDWRVTPGSLDALVFLDSNHGGRSVAKRMTAQAALARMMPQVIFGIAGVAMQAARIHGVAQRVPAYSLRLGNLANAESHLKHIGTA